MDGMSDILVEPQPSLIGFTFYNKPTTLHDSSENNSVEE